jgi:hypothetical protein
MGRMSGYGYKVLLDMISGSPVAPKRAEAPYVFRARVSGESKLDMNTRLEFGVPLIHKAIKGAVTSVVLAEGRLARGALWYWAGVTGTVVEAMWNFGVTPVMAWPERG